MAGCPGDPGPTRDPRMDGGNIPHSGDGIDAAEEFRPDQGTGTIGVAKVHDALPVKNCHARRAACPGGAAVDLAGTDGHRIRAG